MAMETADQRFDLVNEILQKLLTEA
jgi:hypothetical protein